MAKPLLTRSRALLLAGAAGLLLTGMLAATDSKTRPVGQWLALAHTDAQAGDRLKARLQLADDTPAPRSIEADALLKGSPESRLIGIYQRIAESRLDEALFAADQLVQAFPTFKLAHLVRADLLASRARPLPSFGAAAAASAPELGGLRDEALLRIRALQERPPAGAVPAEFVLLPPSVKMAIAVDTSRARLYLFENSPKGMRLVSDNYVSVGKQGVDKLVEGDQRTPLGVYFISDRIGAASLEDRFGAGALPLNYPNAYDKLKGRTGSGILLHGVPSNTYARPPLDSDGCVAMSNEDLLRLAARIPLLDTPVVITRQVQWVSPDRTAAARQAFVDTLDRWKAARLQADLDALGGFYRPLPAAGTSSAYPDQVAAEARNRQRLAQPATAIEDLSVLTWSDEKSNMVVTFREQVPGVKRDRIMRQYWANADGKGWRILSESPVR